MKITTSSKITKADALFICLPEKKTKNALPTQIDAATKKIINSCLANKDFKGKKGEVLQIFPSQTQNKKTYLLGAGECKDAKDYRVLGVNAVRKAKKAKAAKITILLPKSFEAQKVASGCILGNYKFKISNDKEAAKKEVSITQATLVSDEKQTKKEIEDEVALAHATNYTRELINLPANKLGPNQLAEKALKDIKGKGVKVKVLRTKEIERLGMGSLFGVGKGSREEPNVIVLEYKGGSTKKAPIAIVGKGVCFDSGGYNLKPTNYIEEMKQDMAGAASVMGIFKWCKETQPQINVVGIIGAVENMVSGNAFRPGDILTAMNDKTIEITNTDAEGRLVLADCLYYAATKFKPAQMVDLATLTGACVAALGHEITAVMGNKKVVTALQKASEKANETLWELPITDLFREKIKGQISDYKNWTAGVSAGSSMGGAFLEAFTEKIPWAHLDIAGTAFLAKGGNDLGPAGATGVMVRTLKEYLVGQK